MGAGVPADIRGRNRMAKKATKAELIQEWCETDKGWVPIVPHHQEDHLHALSLIHI